MFHLFLMRHAKSCSNHARRETSAEFHNLSQSIRDPGLTVHGAETAAAYRPILRTYFANKPFVGSSGLRRAYDTARLVTDCQNPVTVPHFKENGNFPENIPESERAHESPNWIAFQRALRRLLPSTATDALIVGHGSFLASQFPEMGAFNNLDGVFITGTWIGDRLKIHTQQFIRGPTTHFSTADRCSIPKQERFIQQNIKPFFRNMAHRRKSTRKQFQRGAGYTMPHAWFNNGAQFAGTSSYQTGQGLAGTTDTMARVPLTQTQTQTQAGGRSRRHSRRQNGGWTPAIMGSFVARGSSLAPVAYMLGSRMFGSKTQSRRSRKSSRSRRSRSA